MELISCAALQLKVKKLGSPHVINIRSHTYEIVFRASDVNVGQSKDVVVKNLLHASCLTKTLMMNVAYSWM